MAQQSPSGGNRVFVTGIGVVSPLGLDTQTTWYALLDGTSGVDNISAFDAESFDTHFAAEVKGFDAGVIPDKKQARRMDRFAQFAVVAT
jgi:3-oxoacyl-[acyl-carrier-protein] synthase II